MTDSERPPPSKPSRPSPESPSDSALLDALDTRFKALTGALTGIEHEIRLSREDRDTDARLSRGGHAFTQGAIRAHRSETDRQLAEIGVVRANVSEILALVRSAPRVEAAAVTNPLSGEPIRAPSRAAVAEHLFTLPMAIAIVAWICGRIAAAGFFGIDSPWHKLMFDISTNTAPLIAQLGQLWHSRNVRNKMAIANGAESVDARAAKELAEGGPR